MSQIDVATEAPGEGTHIPGEETVDASGTVLSVQQQAEAVGWYEKDGGLSAEEFIEKRNGHNGLLRKDLNKVENQLASALKQIEESNATQKSMAEFLQKSNADSHRRGYDKAIADAAAEMKQAVDESDGDAFEKASKLKDHLEEQREKIDEQVIVQTQTPIDPVQQDILNYQDAHPELFDTSVKAEAWQKELIYQGKRGLSFTDAVDKATEVVRQTHLPQRSPMGPVGGEVASGPVSEFSQLPAAAKAAYAKFAKASPDFTKEAYLKSYNEAG